MPNDALEVQPGDGRRHQRIGCLARLGQRLGFCDSDERLRNCGDARGGEQLATTEVTGDCLESS
jgi:hypothetical protein